MSSTRTARYLGVLALPSVPLTFGSALIGRAAYALVFLPLLYIVEAATGSIALAGVTVAAYGAGAAFLAPLRAWLIDRFGATKVLCLLVLAFGGSLTAIAILSLLDAPGATFLVLAAFAGVVAPPLGPTMRVAWGRLAPNPEYLRKALSLDAVIEELLYLTGPALSGVALAFFAPGIVLLAPAFLVIAGGLVFVSGRVVREMPSRAIVTDAERLPSLMRRRAFVGILLPVLVAGGVSGALSVSVPVIMTGHSGSTAAGIALGLFAAGSAVGGLLFGALTIPGGAARQLVALAAALLALSSLLAVVTGAVGISVVLASAGLFFSPIMIVAYVAAQGSGGEHQQNSATTWVNTSHNIGASAGSALAGILIQSHGVPLSIIAVVAAGVLLVAAGGALARPAPPSARTL